MAKLQTQGRYAFSIHADIIDSENILTANEKLMYIILLRYGSQAFPSLNTLAKKSGLSKKTVQRTLDTLEEKKLLIRTARRNEDNGHTSNLYILHDNARYWKAKTAAELETAVNETELDRAIQIIRAEFGNDKRLELLDMLRKEKELSTMPPQQTVENSTLSNKNYKTYNNKSQNKFNNFQQNEYDFELLEQILNK